MRREALTVTAASSIALLTLIGIWSSDICVAADTEAAAQPNIILIMTDDQGYGDLGVHGNAVVRTPRIDAFAAESASMSQFYVSPVCSPTRAALMTGRYPYRTRVVDTFKGRSMMDSDEITIAETLQSVGYATGLFGKWHLGDNYPLRPMEQGFDEVWMHRGGGLAQPSEPLANRRRYTDPILFHNGKEVQTQGFCTDVYFDRAIDFINASVDAKRPFFSYIATNAPHGPFHDVPTDKLHYYQQQDLSAVGATTEKHRDTVARVFAMVENIDDNVGRLLDHLDSRDLNDSTIVIFMVDNGPNTARYVGPFRKNKGHVHEGGIRSPFFFRWPQKVKAGTASNILSGHIDVFPTLVAAAGATLPNDRTIDGRDLMPALTGQQSQWPDDRAMVLQVHRGNRPIAGHHFGIRTKQWKLVHPTGFQNEVPDQVTPMELYRADIDPGESDDLSEQYPDVVRDLRGQYQNWFDDVSTTRPDNFAPPRIIIGNAAEPTTV
ncbi:MAG: arylsulfatase, partial [Planctomycetota bacterium]